MKELDVLLERFLERNAAELAGGAWPELERLLAWEDDRLWDCLQDPARAAARPHAVLRRAIRDEPSAPT